MFVCLCNGLTDRDIEEAVDCGARDEEAIYAHHECEEICGRCKPVMQSVIAGADTDDMIAPDADWSPFDDVVGHCAHSPSSPTGTRSFVPAE